MITRNKNYEKRPPFRNAHKVYIICEGQETEPSYFSFFKELSSNLEVIVIPPENGTDSIKLKALADKLFFYDTRKYVLDYQSHDSLWFVIDTDSWEEEGKIDQLRKFCASKNEDSSQLCNVAQSNPSFEIWLYYHFYEEKPLEREVERFRTFKEYVNATIAGGFDFQRDPVRIEEAVINARKNSKGRFSTEVYKLAEAIIPFVAPDLKRLRNKM